MLSFPRPAGALVPRPSQSQAAAADATGAVAALLPRMRAPAPAQRMSFSRALARLDDQSPATVAQNAAWAYSLAK